MDQMIFSGRMTTLGDAIRDAIAAAVREGAQDIADELRAILMMVPVEEGGDYRN